MVNQLQVYLILFCSVATPSLTFWNGGSTKLNGSPHKYSINVLSPYHCIWPMILCKHHYEGMFQPSGAVFEFSATSATTLIYACLQSHNMSLGINQVTGMILCSYWCWGRGIKGAMKDQIINSRANQISHILINYSVFARSWMHSLLVLQATQQWLTETLAIHSCPFYYHARSFSSGYSVWIQSLHSVV